MAVRHRIATVCQWIGKKPTLTDNLLASWETRRRMRCVCGRPWLQFTHSSRPPLRFNYPSSRLCSRLSAAERARERAVMASSPTPFGTSLMNSAPDCAPPSISHDSLMPSSSQADGPAPDHSLSGGSTLPPPDPPCAWPEPPSQLLAHAAASPSPLPDRVRLRQLVSKLEERSVEDIAAGLWQPRDFANVQWAMGRMGVTPSPRFNHPSNLDEPSALSNTCRLCAGRWGVCWSASSLPHLPSFEGRHLAMALWGLASCQVLPSPAWHRAACLRAQQLVGRPAAREGLTLQGVALTLWGLAHLALLAGRRQQQGPGGGREQQGEEGPQELISSSRNSVPARGLKASGCDPTPA
ncbi:hypothetical protein HaLaN_14632 [Haematococcus lacustris]|uniref:Uncharacterized protein n=1 Tax=Haematococcus lacustris TaxID=44745 RepID=A0A699ZGI0_HAELA|nr:hypothetical protein HaLaN_14632 [Haematococcus lacustris]